MKIYDVSVPISVLTPVFPGDPQVTIETAASIASGDVANVSRLEFGAHTATHVDAPKHFIDDGGRVKDLPLEILIGQARVVEISDDQPSVTVDDVAAFVQAGDERVLFKTRNSRLWQPLIERVADNAETAIDGGSVDAETTRKFHQDFVYIEPDAAHELVKRGVRLIGIDYLSVEKYGSETFETHRALLGAGVVIIEGLNLHEVEAGEYEVICLPLKISSGAGDGAPARVVLRSK